MKNLFKIFGLIALIAVIGFAMAGCKNDDDGSGSGGGGTGCSSISAGTQCSAHSSCSSHFLCLTGQGSDDNCTTGCSCQ